MSGAKQARPSPIRHVSHPRSKRLATAGSHAATTSLRRPVHPAHPVQLDDAPPGCTFRHNSPYHRRAATRSFQGDKALVAAEVVENVANVADVARVPVSISHQRPDPHVARKMNTHGHTNIFKRSTYLAEKDGNQGPRAGMGRYPQRFVDSQMPYRYPEMEICELEWEVIMREDSMIPFLHRHPAPPNLPPSKLARKEVTKI
ncbi:hypothetical protein DFJ77DRAFT_442809 [Powellomyces hirtus]|nr:hypothetical protein DFJ77DRAFT_442809 [Powellomyces hirtus]